jgi:8-oxo-dGTP diphosphatase
MCLFSIGGVFMAAFKLTHFSDADLKVSLTTIEKNAKAIHKDRFLYSFTDHGIEHSYRMINFCESFIINNGKSRFLNEYEKFILISAIYLHDIGIQMSKKECIYSFATDYGISIPYGSNSDDIASFIRSNHHLISSYWIQQNIKTNPSFVSAYVGDGTLGEIIALVIESHGLDFLVDNKYNLIPCYKGVEIRINILCTLLSLADVADCDCRRIDPSKLSYVELPQISRLHWFKHYYVASVRLNEKSIHIQYRFPTGIPCDKKSIYYMYFSHQTLHWFNYIKSKYLHIYRDAGFSFDIEEDLSPITTELIRLSEDDFSFIEEACVDIAESKYAGGIEPKKVVIGIMKHDSRVLMVERRISEGALTWQFPAGTIKPGHSEEETIIKEIKEETGISCKARRRLGRRIHPDTNVICYYWVVDYLDGCLVNGDCDENKSVCWVDLAEYSNKVSSNLFNPIKQYLEEEI